MIPIKVINGTLNKMPKNSIAIGELNLQENIPYQIIAINTDVLYKLKTRKITVMLS